MSTKTFVPCKQTNGGNGCAAAPPSSPTLALTAPKKNEVHFTLPDSSGYSRMEYFKKAHLKLRELVKPIEAESQHLSVCGSV